MSSAPSVRSVEADLFKTITDRIIEALDAGTVPWRQPWSGGAEGLPRNAVTGRPYHGVNVWTLGLASTMAGLADPRWLTFRQAREAGGHVRKGERSELVVFWKPWSRTERDTTSGEESTRRGALLKYFRVFNVAQCEGLKLAPLAESPTRTHEPIEAAQAIVDRYAPTLRGGLHHGGSRAFYRPSDDAVSMPAPETFEEAAAYYAVTFHELGHSTGHRTRLAREGVVNPVRFGSHDYSREELVAEFCASFLCGMADVERRDGVAQSAAYIAGWKRALTSDPRAIVVAAGHAEKAARCVLGEAAAVAEPEPVEDVREAA
jgi:antirestriction protein ArdC